MFTFLRKYSHKLISSKIPLFLFSVLCTISVLIQYAVSVSVQTIVCFLCCFVLIITTVLKHHKCKERFLFCMGLLASLSTVVQTQQGSKTIEHIDIPSLKLNNAY